MTSLSQLIHAGKGEAIRIKAILRSLVPVEDLVGVISIPFFIPSLNKGNIYLTPLAILKPVNDGYQNGTFRFILLVCLLFVCIDGLVLEPDMSAGFCPDHKAAMVLFLERVYGIEDQNFLLYLLEVGFLPDMRAAASLETVSVKKFIRT